MLACIRQFWLVCRGLGFVAVGVALVACDADANDDPQRQQKLEYFENHVRPLLANNCYKCHSSSEEDPKGDLMLDSLAGMLTGGYSGAAIVPGDADASLITEALGYENNDMQMPPKGKLSDDEIAVFTKWINDGAVWPDEAAPTAAKKVFDLNQRKAEHWCWQPVKPLPPPQVTRADWGLDPLDAFILAKLEEKQIAPAADAPRRAWLRRATFAITGLPPTPEELAAFEADTGSDAYERVVDRLLASPRFGEAWGRHWLDLVRYAETYGHEFDFPIHHAWRYRDYVIDALNDDLPYDQFLTEQIAGDLLPQPRINPRDGANESIRGTAFWFLHEQTHGAVDVSQHEADRIDNQIDVMGKSMLGITLGCARCHDHKFDAISTHDVYSLWGYIKSSRLQRAILDPHGKIAAGLQQMAELCRQGDRIVATAIQPKQTTTAETTSTDADIAAQEASGDNKPNDKVNELVLFEDFSRPDYANWYATGHAFGTGPTQPGQWNSLSRKAEWIAPDVAHSGLLSPKLLGVLRSKTFTVEHTHIWIRVAGKNAKIRLVVNNYIMDEFSNLLFRGLTHDINNEAFTWIALQGDLKKYLGHRGHLELIDDGDGYLAVDRIVFSNGPQPPDPPATAAPSLANVSAIEPQLAELAKQLDEIAAALPAPVRSLAIADGNGVDSNVYVRGSHRNVGELAPRGFIEALAGHEQPAPPTDRSGRWELAEKIVDPANPLTARVAVNRIWHHLFGRGIVATVDNFGVLGQPPTHPELLDHLADRFVRDGWSVKRMIRAIVLSRTYRQASQPEAASVAADPQNLLLHSMPIRRLSAESIRDSILATSGRLDTTMHGPSVPVHLTAFMDGRGRPGSGPLDGNGRRSIYVEIRRNFLSPMMLAFDSPIPFNTVGARSVTNVPAQALTLMNDPLVATEAKRFAERAMSEQPSSATDRIERMYQLAFGRSATSDELTAAQAFLASQSQQYGIAAEGVLTDVRPWADLAQVLFNCKEFVFVE